MKLEISSENETRFSDLVVYEAFTVPMQKHLFVKTNDHTYVVIRHDSSCGGEVKNVYQDSVVRRVTKLIVKE